MTVRTLSSIALAAIAFVWVCYIAVTLVIVPTPAAQAAAPTPVPSATLRPGEKVYVVQSGDSAWNIAVKEYGDGHRYTYILNANNLTEESKLRVGMKLIIPPLPGVEAPGATFVPQPTAILGPTPVPTMASVTVPTKAPPTPTPTTVSLIPAPPAGMTDAVSQNRRTLSTAINFISGMFAFTSLVCAFLAYQAYVRVKRLERITIIRRRARGYADLI